MINVYMINGKIDRMRSLRYAATLYFGLYVVHMHKYVPRKFIVQLPFIQYDIDTLAGTI